MQRLGVSRRSYFKHGPIERRAYRIAEFLQMVGMSRSTFYRRVRQGVIKIHYIGETPIITAETVRELLGGE